MWTVVWRGCTFVGKTHPAPIVEGSRQLFEQKVEIVPAKYVCGERERKKET